MQLCHQDMVRYGEIIPKHPVRYSIYIQFITSGGDFRRMSHFPGKCIVPAMNTVRIHTALSGVHKVENTVVNSIEQSLSIKWTTLKYDCYLTH